MVLLPVIATICTGQESVDQTGNARYAMLGNGAELVVSHESFFIANLARESRDTSFATSARERQGVYECWLYNYTTGTYDIICRGHTEYV